jgi:hypothetical protein
MLLYVVYNSLPSTERGRRGLEGNFGSDLFAVEVTTWNTHILN